MPALAVATTLMFIARPAAVFLCLAPFRFAWREKAFISWVGLRGAVGIFLASIPLLVGLPNAYLYFDIAFVVVLTSLLIQGWTITAAARRLHIALPRHDPLPRRVELDLPGQLEQEIVGYPVSANSPYLKRGLLPSWARPTLVVREQKILSPLEAQPVRQGDYVYLLAPPEKAQALDRFFVDMPPPAAPDPRLLGDFFVSGDVTLGALADIYGLSIAPDAAEIVAGRSLRRRNQAPAEAGRHRAARADRAGGASGDERPRRQRRACGWRKTMRRRQRLRASSRRPRAICGRVSDDASRPRLPPVLDFEVAGVRSYQRLLTPARPPSLPGLTPQVGLSRLAALQYCGTRACPSSVQSIPWMKRFF